MGTTTETSNKLLPDSIVNCIERFRIDKWNEYHLNEEFFNPLLRADIFTLLEKFCIVVYYPLNNDETNNGFHVSDIPFSDGNKDVVFINTNQDIEKQIFTAAHELGHIWRLDKYVKDALNIDLNKFEIEQIMNRFAAELMIPKKYFTDLFFKEVHKSKGKDFIRLVAFLMSEFFVPYKSIVWRLYELKIINEDNFNKICPTSNNGHETDPLKARLLNYLKQCIKEEGYDKLQQKSKRKWINNFPEYLKIVEANGTINADKIATLRDKFDISDENIQMPISDITFEQ